VPYPVEAAFLREVAKKWWGNRLLSVKAAVRLRTISIKSSDTRNDFYYSPRIVLRVTPRRATSERGLLAMIHKDSLDASVTAAVKPLQFSDSLIM